MATSITLRSVKGSALTHQEVDDNFSNLKTTADAAVTSGAVTTSGLTMATGKLLGRTTASSGAIEEISPGVGLALSSGQLEVDFTGYLTATDAATTYQTQAGMSSYLTTASASSTYQPLDGDLTAIAGIAGTSGLLKKTAADTWSLDTNNYLTTTDAASTYQTQSGMSSYLTTSTASSTYQTQAAMSSYLTTADASSTYLTQTNAASTYQTQSGMSSYLTTSAAASNYQPLDSDLTAIAALSTTGLVSRTGAGTFATVTAPTGAIVGTTDTQTLSSKTIEFGTFTNGYVEEVVTANTGTAYTIDLANGSLQILTLTANCTFTFPTATSGTGFTLFLKQDSTGSRTVTWPSAVKWPGGTAPTITSTASKGDKYVFFADGTNWIGSVAGQNYL